MKVHRATSAAISSGVPVRVSQQRVSAFSILVRL
jgi:hypothetical protein